MAEENHFHGYAPLLSRDGGGAYRQRTGPSRYFVLHAGVRPSGARAIYAYFIRAIHRRSSGHFDYTHDAHSTRQRYQYFRQTRRPAYFRRSFWTFFTHQTHSETSFNRYFYCPIA